MSSQKISVRVIYPGERRRESGHQVLCRINKDVKLEPAALEAFCFKQITDQDLELMFLAGAIAFIDRTVRRLVEKGWRRQLHVVMPVARPRFWQQPAIVGSIVSALQFLTGDAWSFEFPKASMPLRSFKQAELDLGQGDFVVIPFSNGLDSFAQSRLLKVEGINATPVRVTAWNRGLAGSREWITDDDGSKYRRVAVPIKLVTKPNAEQSFRTRTFVFSVLAGLAASLANARQIVIPEAGQGALGPSLVPFGAESPHRGSHPGFSRRMMIFFEAFWGKHVSIDHPQLWRTKGKVLSALKDAGVHSGWDKTRSCSRDQRVIRTERHKLLHCGICSGCLLRRMAVFSAGLEEQADKYLWSNLSADSLDGALCSDALSRTTTNDRDIAVHSVLAMEELARVGERSGDQLRIRSTLLDAYGNDSEKISTEADKLRSLLSTHRSEWRAFTDVIGKRSWIAQQIALI